MNKKLLILVILGVFCFSGEMSLAQGSSEAFISQVKEAVKAGSAKELSKYLSETVDVMIDEKLESYSKAQAEFVLRDFFKIHPVSEFNILHKGSSKGGQPFVIGQYKSGSETFRLFMKIKKDGNSQLVHEIRFSKE